ncbi:MAG: hypothetical protein AB7M12_08940 [Hyphomonadaceae bacterium]
MPVLPANSSEAVDAVCSWAAANAVSFDGSVVERVLVSHVVSLNSIRPEQIAILEVFLQRKGNPQVLALPLAPDHLAKSFQLAPFRGLVAVAGVWAFAKRPLAECDSRGRENLVSTKYDDVELCILVNRLTTAPDGYVDADYRNLAVNTPSVAWPVNQRLSLQILTLKLAGKVVGRSIRASGFALPNEIGNVSRVCEGAPLPLAFESN